MRVPFDRSLAQWIRELESQDKLYTFYNSPEWKRLRAQVLAEAHHECQECIKHGRYTRATTVHHINEVKVRPDLALSRWYKVGDEMRPNLVALCHRCHDDAHDRMRGSKPKEPSFTNVERW